ncbi:MAG: YraN family protein [Candidatus Vogelbacteria bacterium]|nr:YraN family protein [Candidatus Vogelbacteria bacterium]
MPNKTVKRETGDRGEEIAAVFFVKQGFLIVERNHWRKWGEIDIVAKNIKDNIYRFVEVKTVSRSLRTLDLENDGGYSPADNITFEKKKRFSRVIQTYLMENKLGECDWQADVALVYLDTNSDESVIEMIEDIDL